MNEQSMDEMWGDTTVRSGAGSDADRAALFRDGNYGMFIHWGLYTLLGGKWRDQTLYGIGEWIKLQFKIPDQEYMALAGEMNPVDFDAAEIVRVAKEAGMKWIIITAKHHEGFAMYRSAHPFNIVDATPFGRDPMQELSAACREAGLGFGFYYSHYQDWTAPGGCRGPERNPDGSEATFEQYFHEKCLPQVEELCTGYGKLDFVWFDTPGKMPEALVKLLGQRVCQLQPDALLCSRIGHGMGDYASLGDMEVPVRNEEGLWETCDTTNDSWGAVWYDQNWKDTREIVHRAVATVARGGTYLLNVGLDARGCVPGPAARYLLRAGEWIRRHPEVIYGAGPSPWQQGLPWGDVTTCGNRLNLVVFDAPGDGKLYLPGLRSRVVSARMRGGEGFESVDHACEGDWTVLTIPFNGPREAPACVVDVELEGPPEVDAVTGIVPNQTVTLHVDFATVTGARKKALRWMEKFGEWKCALQVDDWGEDGRASWEVDVARAGDYRVELTCRGGGRLVWRVETETGDFVQNQQGSSGVYGRVPLGLLSFKTPGRHILQVVLLEGDRAASSLRNLHLSPAE